MEVADWGNSTYGGSTPSGLSDVHTLYLTINAFAALRTDGTVAAWGQADSGPSAPGGGLGDVHSNGYASVRREAARSWPGTMLPTEEQCLAD